LAESKRHRSDVLSLKYAIFEIRSGVLQTGEAMSKKHECACCGATFTGKVTSSIHRDGFAIGPEVPLCDACGGHELPSCEEIWERIAARIADGATIEVLP